MQAPYNIFDFRVSRAASQESPRFVLLASRLPIMRSLLSLLSIVLAEGGLAA